jgi:hypothetical protein
MNQREWSKCLAEATVLLDFPVETNGRRQRGLEIASDPANIVKDRRGWHVGSQSCRDVYLVTAEHCTCPDSNAPRSNDIKWCKHRIAVSYWTLAHKLGAPIAAVHISEMLGLNGRWQRQQWLVADEGDDRQYRVFLKRQDGHVHAICDVGGLKCSRHKRMVCRHVRRAVEKAAQRNGLELAWSTDPDRATRLKRFGGDLFTVVSEHGPVAYAVTTGGYTRASDDDPDDELARKRRERDQALPVQPKKVGRWK